MDYTREYWQDPETLNVFYLAFGEGIVNVEFQDSEQNNIVRSGDRPGRTLFGENGVQFHVWFDAKGKWKKIHDFRNDPNGGGEWSYK